MRYRLRTLLIVLAVGPLLGAWGYRAVEDRLRTMLQRKALSEINIAGFELLKSIRVNNPDHPNAAR